ncbi:MAG: LacI family DNA-binding transcriptional regulator [Planctomycetota bacterium]|nr:LacI family DNA-binding transcriptional regulator [Planctomycetota bacterium]
MAHTIMSVAKEVGVSKSTVSLVANRSPKVREETRQKVLNAFKKLNYHPNAAAKALVSQKNHSIGIGFYDVSYITEPVFANILAGVIEGANQHEYSIILCTTTESQQTDEEAYFMKLVNEKRIDGLILYDSVLSDQVIRQMKERQFPMVLVERTLPQADVPAVLVDNEDGMRRLTEHFIKLGHRRIGYIAGHSGFTNVVEKIQGYHAALDRHGVTSDMHLVKRRSADDGAKQLRQFTEELLATSPRPTAIIIDNDRYILDLLHAIQECGLSVPKDIAVAGYGDAEPIVSSIKPALTTVKVPFRDMGREAVKLLLKLTNKQEIEHPQVRLKGKLIVRDSCEALQEGLATA